MSREFTMRNISYAGNLICALLFSLLFAACGSDTAAATSMQTLVGSNPYVVKESLNVAYGPLSAEKLDLCQPVSAPGLRPAVLLIHGGSWIMGDKSVDDTLCEVLAERGFVAATINYRLARSAQPATQWPAQLVDAQLAVRWMRAHAAQLNLDTRRLCAWGDSAGAHLAVFLGTLQTIHAGDEAHLYSDESPAVSCVVDEFGPVDLTGNNLPDLVPALRTLFGSNTYQGNPAPYRDASPIFDITDRNALTLIVQGTRDTVVPPTHESEALLRMLQEHSVSVQYIGYTGRHGFLDLSSQQITAIRAQEIAFITANI